MDRDFRPELAVPSQGVWRRRLISLALALAAFAAPIPGRAALPYQGWTPSSFGMLPECGKYSTLGSGYLAGGCIYTRRIRFHPTIPGLAIAGTLRHGAWMSVGGNAWAPLAPHCVTTAKTVQNITGSILPCGVEDIAFDPFEPRTIYLTGFEFSNPYLRGYTFEAGGVFKSTDLGASWKKISTRHPNLRGSALAVIRAKPSEKATILAGSFQHADHDVDVAQSIAASYDDGATWRSVRFPDVKNCKPFVVSASNRLVANLLVHPTNPNIVYAGTNGGLYQSSDRGRSFKPILTRCLIAGKVNVGSVWGVAVSPDGKTLYASPWDGTLRVASVTKPTSWRTVMTLDGTQVSSIMLDRRDPTGKTMYVAALNAQPGKTYLSAGVFRVQISPPSATLLSDSWLAGVDHEIPREIPRAPYTLIKSGPAFWLAQSTLDSNVIFLSQALAGMFWRSLGERLPDPTKGSPTQPGLPRPPTAVPTAAAPTSFPTAIPTATPTF